MRKGLILALILVLAGALSAQDAAIDSLALARKWTGWLYENQLDSLHLAFAPEAQTGEMRADLAQQRETLRQRAGKARDLDALLD